MPRFFSQWLRSLSVDDRDTLFSYLDQTDNVLDVTEFLKELMEEQDATA